MPEDIRWQQRFANFRNAFAELRHAADLSLQRELSMLEKQGLIQAFEYTHELAWNVMKDFFLYQGNSAIRGSRDAIREAFKYGLIEDGEIWMETIQTRNQTSHAYDRRMAEVVVETVLGSYCGLFRDFERRMEEIEREEDGRG